MPVCDNGFNHNYVTHIPKNPDFAEALSKVTYFLLLSVVNTLKKANFAIR